MPTVQPHIHVFHPRFALLVAAAVAAIAIGVAAVRNDVSLPAVTSASVANRQPLTLTDRVLPAFTLPGFITTGHQSVVHSPLTWAAGIERSGTPAREAQRLRRIGFVGGVEEQLHGRFPLADEAVSIVEQFRSAADARAELAYQQQVNLAPHSGQRISRLHGIEIPGAVGWVARSRQVTGINVAFSSGPYFYLVGSGVAPGTPGAPTAHHLVAAAQTEDLFANGCVVRKATTHNRQISAVSSYSTGPMLLH